MIISNVTTEAVLFGNSLLLGESSVTVSAGNSVKVRVYAGESGENNINWTSENEDIAVVSQDGIITGVSEGKTTISVSNGEKTAVCDVEVLEAVHLKSIQLSSNDLSMITGDSRKLTVSYDPEDAVDDRTIIWESSNDSVATIENGIITAVSIGTATVTARVGELTDICRVTVAAAPEQKPSVPPGLVVRNPSANTLTVVWGRVPDCTYNVYIDGNRVDVGTGCYTHTYQNISSGDHTVSVVSVNPSGIESDPATKVITVQGVDTTTINIETTMQHDTTNIYVTTTGTEDVTTIPVTTKPQITTPISETTNKQTTNAPDQTTVKEPVFV